MADPYSDAIIDLIQDGLADMRAVVPGTVDRVARALGRELDVDFAPGIGRKMAAEDVADGPVPSAPVLFPAGAKFSMRWPLGEGDEALGLACDRNPELWRANRTVGEAHYDQRPHAHSNVVLLPVSITAPDEAPDPTGDAWVVSGGEGEAIRLDLGDGALTLTKSGVSVATITLSADGEITLTPAAGQSVNVGGTAALALGQKVIDGIDTMLAGGVPVAQDGGVALLSTMVSAWNPVKAAILAQIVKGA